MADMSQALDFVLTWEGGFSDNESDPGGRTRFGISEEAHPEAWEDGPPSEADAIAIYRREYWRPVGGIEMHDQQLATTVFDTAVNMGTRRAIKYLQRAANLHGAALVMDGVWGPNTRAATDALDADRLVKTVVAFRARFRIERVEAARDQRGFLYGWLRRDFALLKLGDET